MYAYETAQGYENNISKYVKKGNLKFVSRNI